MTEKQIEAIVKLIIANHAQNFFDSLTFSDIDVSEADFQKMQETFEKIAKKLSDGMPLNLGSVEQCIDYVLNKNQL